MLSLSANAFENQGQLLVGHVAVVDVEGRDQLAGIGLDRIQVLRQSRRHLVRESQLAQEQLVLVLASKRRQAHLVGLLELDHEFQVCNLLRCTLIEAVRRSHLQVTIVLHLLNLRGIKIIQILQLLLLLQVIYWLINLAVILVLPEVVLVIDVELPHVQILKYVLKLLNHMHNLSHEGERDLLPHNPVVMQLYQVLKLPLLFRSVLLGDELKLFFIALRVLLHLVRFGLLVQLSEAEH